MTTMTDITNSKAPENQPTLKQGDTGEVVKELQRLLRNYYCYSGPIDGVLDSETVGGIILFQHRVFIPEDGIVGYKTWQALYEGRAIDLPILKYGSQGELVKALQQRLQNAGYYTGLIDGDFSFVTEAGIKSFQLRNNLKVDGIVGDRTWTVLSNTPIFES
ncbi:Peptidoglycan-binding domain 1 [Trichormus variabilis ATCC 29413]|uniref:Peptidoglycan-binding domain 1 n=2 Tax=Anabaena variabilis TaxID=264691 RepID=Q3MH54_TRIV2|nr:MULTISPECIES: peptidoglycan-binding protein [Nostocaceae]ABA19682.1 Peptidoglycan-binding domain 1 [Trichormus variabilis ATCC 29413]MBC1213320.1 peptidoglycan-binding protein [Trichormus variabilis ARAD]MBC1257246.1 peptidoglycan-binding protein [Trichormus variabilis V5]MBC1265975.1 peptidoglycan-binding protein [Trichormus variabilis FSR]MBC1302920.1 peptidoglycan-binding protein [Trichormus variabilis N2B]